MTRHLLSFERLSRILQLTPLHKVNMTLTCWTKRTMRNTHTMWSTKTSETPASHHSLESFALCHTLNIDTLTRNKVLTSEFSTYRQWIFDSQESHHTNAIEFTMWTRWRIVLRLSEINTIGWDILLYYHSLVVETWVSPFTIHKTYQQEEKRLLSPWTLSNIVLAPHGPFCNVQRVVCSHS